MIDPHPRNGFYIYVRRDYAHDPPTSYTWHDPECIPRYLNGHSKDEHGREYDSRKQNFYDAERDWAERAGIVTWGALGYEQEEEASVLTLKETAEFIEDVWSRAWWQRRYDVLDAHLKDGRGAKRAIAFQSGDLSIKRGHRNPATILHELTHLATDDPHAWHGRLFAARFREIVGWYFGDEEQHILTECYRRHGVKWHPNRSSPSDTSD